MEDLIKKLIKEVPEIKKKEKLIVALIKTEIHKEKYSTWKHIVNEFYHDPEYFKKRIINTKIDTHKKLSNLKENINWVNQYYKEIEDEKN